MLRISLLGRPVVTLEEAPVTDFVSDKALLLLCYLAMEPAANGHTRSALAGLLWGDMPEERARANLRMALYNLQKLLPQQLQSSRKTIGLNPEQSFWLDVTHFQTVLAQDDTTALATAVALYRGDFLQGILLADSPELDSWLRRRRESLRLQALQALDQLAGHYTRQGEWAAAIEATQRLLHIEPWRESSHRALMRLLLRTGRQNAALHQYETCRRLLAEELGVEPMVETTALYERLLVARRRGQPRQLPPQPTTFIGRGAELGRLFLLLTEPQQRLITLSGPGGSGKTRLALAAAAAQAYAYLDGVIFVPLASVQNAATLMPALAGALNLRLSGDTEDKAQLLAYLRDKEMLLVLDNVEQIIEPIADMLSEFLAAAPGLNFMVTSREYLRLRWETRVTLGGLPLPEADRPVQEIAQAASVRLFVQVAQRVQPAFQLSGQETTIAAICRLVDGSPLAIELAAALLDREEPQRLLVQLTTDIDRLATPLRDVPQRHRSLRAVFDHSWEMLSSAEQAALTRLAAFSGGFSAAAARQVAGALPALLANLVAKSLLAVAEDGRFQFHQVVAHYASERLERSERLPATQARHAAYFAQLLETADGLLQGAQQTATAQRHQADLENIRAGWHYSAATGALELLQRALPGLARFYRVAGFYQMGVDDLTAALTVLPAAAPVAIRVALHLHQAGFLLERHEFEAALTAVSSADQLGLETVEAHGAALLARSRVLFHQGDHEAAQATISQALILARDNQLSELLALCWQQQGNLAEQAGDYDEAEQALKRSLQHYQTMGDPIGMAEAYQRLGRIHFRRFDYVTAKEMNLEALSLRSRLDPTGLSSARVLVNLGTITYNLGEVETARGYLQEALQVFQQVGDRSGMALAANMLGRMAAFASEFDQAQTYFAQALALRQEMGQAKGAADVQRHMGDLALSLGAYDDALDLLNAAHDTYLLTQDRRSLGSTMASMALAHHYQADHDKARQQAEAALAVATALDNMLLRGYALKSLAHAWRGLQAWSEAADVYEAASVAWQSLDDEAVVAELQAARAMMLAKLGREGQALALLTPVVATLAATHWPDCDAPGQLYVDVLCVLHAAGDERADDLLRQVQRVLREISEAIRDDGVKRLFVEEKATHRLLLGAEAVVDVVRATLGPKAFGPPNAFGSAS